MIIVDKTRPRFHNLAGGYEIRRKDWAEVTLRFPSFSPGYWDARTVCIVRRVSPNVTPDLTAFHRRTSPTSTVLSLAYAIYCTPS
jgi:hypothetical protein